MVSRYTQTFAATVVAIALLSVARPAPAEVVDRIIATVNDEVITLSDYYKALPIFLQLNQVPPGAYASREGQRALATRMLQELVNQVLLDQTADQHELTVRREAVDDYIGLISQQMGATVDQLREQLAAEGIRFEDFHEFIRLELTKLRVVNVMVTSGISVSDAEVDAVIMERYPDGTVEQYYDVSQILLTPPHNADPDAIREVREQAEQIRRQLVEGADFEELARAHSQDPSRRQGGNMGRFRRGQLPSDFENVVFNLLPGEISEVFETRFGYHIVRLNDRWDESTLELDNIREQIYREIQLEKQNREIERFMAQLQEENIIVVLFDPAELY